MFLNRKSQVHIKAIVAIALWQLAGLNLNSENKNYLSYLVGLVGLIGLFTIRLVCL